MRPDRSVVEWPASLREGQPEASGQLVEWLDPPAEAQPEDPRPGRIGKDAGAGQADLELAHPVGRLANGIGQERDPLGLGRAEEAEGQMEPVHPDPANVGRIAPLSGGGLRSQPDPADQLGDGGHRGGVSGNGHEQTRTVDQLRPRTESVDRPLTRLGLPRAAHRGSDLAAISRR